MSAHTPTPWSVTEGGAIPGAGYAYVTEAEGRKVCYPKREDARRIVACVNACDGLDTELLEARAGTMFNTLRTIQRVAAENDELRDERDRLAGRAKFWQAVCIVLTVAYVAGFIEHLVKGCTA